MVVALILFTLLGHAAIWVGLANRLHAVSVPQWINVLGSMLCHGSLLLLPLAIVVYEWSLPPPIPAEASVEPTRTEGDERVEKTAKTAPDQVRVSDNPMFRRPGWPTLYYFYCWAVGGLYFPWWIAWRLTSRTTKLQLANTITVVDVAEALGKRPAGTPFARVVTGLPFNETFRVQLQEKTLALPRLDPELSGLTIAHISDWHLKGRLGKEYYEEVVRLTNGLQADLICITGDLFDRTKFLTWIPDTFARLKARKGVYFILGNHDIRHPATARSRELLIAAGLVDLGRQPLSIEINKHKIYLAGNERPWFPLAPQLLPRKAGSPAQQPEPHSALRILLAHSPDQITWARRHQFDLMLAGHTHGGQIRLPLIGAVYSPSWYGVKYAGGTFFCSPTLLHVTRGIAGELPLRFNCPPEIAKLTLVAPV